jgi:hypothetical protein
VPLPSRRLWIVPLKLVPPELCMVDVAVKWTSLGALARGAAAASASGEGGDDDPHGQTMPR